MRQFEHIDEFEKAGEQVNTNEAAEQALEVNAQNRHAQIKPAGSTTDSRRKQLDNSCSKNTDVVSLEENQTHLKPAIVDTSSVAGDIIQVRKIP